MSRDILEETRRNGDDLAAVKALFGRLEGRPHGGESEVCQLREEGHAHCSGLA